MRKPIEKPYQCSYELQENSKTRQPMKLTSFIEEIPKENFTGYFKNRNRIDVECRNFFEAFFLLTAEAIKQNQNYNLLKIVDSKGKERDFEDLMNEILIWAMK